jgi:anti-sigma factor RsiW
MKHPEDLLSALVDGELTATERHAVTEHLETCPTCRAELTEITIARDTVRDLPMIDPPPGLIPESAPARRRLLRPVWAWAAAGAAALALVIGLATGPGVSEPEVDLETLANRHTARLVVQPGIQTVRAPAGGG